MENYELLDSYMLSTIEEERKKECKFLDTLDILPYLSYGAFIDNIMDKLAEDYGDEYDGEYMFSTFSQGTFMTYLEDRFENIEFDIPPFRYIICKSPQERTRYDDSPAEEQYEEDFE